MEKKPGLMIAVMDGLKKKGMMKDSSDSEEEKDEGYEDTESYRDHLEQISKELISAVHDEDHVAVADLLEEAFECMEMAPHEEGPHLGESEEE